MSGLKILADSHLDHGLTPAIVAYITWRFATKDGFFTETFDLPEDLGTVPCGLHGPVTGDEPVPDAECEMVVRGTRAGPSRLCGRALRQTRVVTVIAGPHEADPCVLYTAFGGPLAPREPWDPSLCDDLCGVREASIAFWKVHALSRE